MSNGSSGIQNERGDHGIEVGGRQLETRPLQNLPVILGMMGRQPRPFPLAHTSAQKGLQNLAEFFDRDLILDVQTDAMGDGDVNRLAFLEGKRHSHKFGPHGIQPRGLGIEGKPPRAGGFIDPTAQFLGIGEEAVIQVGFDALCLSKVLGKLQALLLNDRIETKLGQELDGVIAPERPRQPARFGVPGKRHVAHDGRQASGEPGLIDVFEQRLSLALVFDRIGAIDQVLQRIEFGEEPGRPLGSNRGDAGDVVRAVAHKSEPIRDLGGRHTEAVLDGALITALKTPIAEPENSDLIIHKLEEILIGGNDDAILPCPGHLARHRGDKVVCLVAIELIGHDSHRFEKPVDPDHLIAEIRRRSLAIRLVGRKDLFTKSRLAGIEDHGEEFRLNFLDEAEQHPQKPVNLAGGKAFGRRKAPHAVVGFERQGMTIDEIERRFLHRARRGMNSLGL